MISSISSNIYAKYVGISKWGSYGSADGKFSNPYGVAVDSSGNVFVVDNQNNRIQKFQLANPCPSSTTLVVPGVCFVTKWGGLPIGSGDGQFKYPRDIAVDSKGDVYVVDTDNNRIQKFQLANPCPSSTTLVVPGVCFVTKWGSFGPGIGQFQFPSGIAVDSSGRVYVADSGHASIQMFQQSNPCPSSTTLVVPGVCFVTTWNYPVVSIISDVAVDSSGRVYVVERDRIQMFQLANPCPSGTTQAVLGVCFVTDWGSSGTFQFQFPIGVAVDSLGDVYVSEYSNQTVQKFQQANPCPSGTTQVVPGVCIVTTWGSQGSGDGQFQNPVGIAVKSTPNICSVDMAWYSGNARVYHFVIATSTDGTTFTNVFSGDSSGTTLNSEKYIIPATNAKYLRVTVNGNTINDWASITELDIFGSFSPTGSCTNNLPISGVTASGNDGNVPQNVLDGSLSTRWSSFGKGQFITANLDSNGDVFVADTNNHRIQQFIDDIIPPRVTIKDPADGTTLTAPTNAEIRAGANDNIGVKQVQFFADSSSRGNVLLGTDTSAPYRFPLTSLSPDKYTLTAIAYDTAGNTQISDGIFVQVTK